MVLRIASPLRRAAAAALAALAALTGAFAPRAAADPAMWVVKDADSTIYLIGTVHMLPPDTRWRDARIDKALNEAGELWLEIADLTSPGAQLLAAWSVFGQGMSFRKSLSERLDPDDLQSLKRAAEQTGFEVSQLDHLRPWLAAMLIGSGGTANTDRTIPGVDVQLQHAFAARRLPVHGFETIDSQIRAFSTLPEKDEMRFLLDTIRSSDLDRDELPALVKTWMAGDAAGISAMVNRPMKANSPALYQALIVKRNAGFANGIERLLRGKGSAVVAIGAAHLAGPDSVQAFLATKGIYAVRQ